jgi:hypothetical protein
VCWGVCMRRVAGGGQALGRRLGGLLLVGGWVLLWAPIGHSGGGPWALLAAAGQRLLGCQLVHDARDHLSAMHGVQRCLLAL